MADGSSPPRSGNGQHSTAQLTAAVEGAPDGRAAAPAGSQSSDSRILRIAYGLVTSDLWLRTVILVGVSVALIMLSFHWHVMTRPTILSFLASQLGTAVLIGAVGAALVQAFIMSAPQTMQKLVDELRSRPREATIEDRLAELTAELRAYELRTRASDTLARMGVVDILGSTEDVAAKICEILTAPDAGDVRLLGISLSALFAGRSQLGGQDPPYQQLRRVLLGQEPFPARGDGIHVRVLLADPACLSLRLLAHGVAGESDEALERLRNEIMAAARHLNRMSKEVADRQNGNSLEVRFYRTVSPFFLFAADQGMLTPSYYQGLALDSGASASAAVWHFSAESLAYQAACRHFDAIWETDSVSCEEFPSHTAIGTDQGIGESGILNIYTGRDKAEARIKWLISHARNRVWIQGVSLSHHLSALLEEDMLGLLQNRSVDTRILILNPDSGQASRKSYRDYLLDHDGIAVIDYEEYVQDIGLHRASQLYGRLRDSARRFESMSTKAIAGNFQVRQYACAPTSYILIADDHALVEQFHYGKPIDAEGSIQAQLQLAREMPLIEYGLPGSDLFPPPAWLNPLAVIEDHFNQVFERFASALSAPLNEPHDGG